MRLLHVVSSVDPKQGGVAETIRTRGEKLVAMGHSVEVASLDAPDSPGIRDYALPLHAMGPTVSKWHYTPRLIPWLRENAHRFDAVVVDGIWEFHGFATRRALAGLATPYFVLPHGMLGLWFKQTYPLKHAKKWIAWTLYEHRLLRDATGVFFASEQERRGAGQSFSLYQARERVVPFGTATPPQNADELRAIFFAQHPQLKGKRVLLFLGRIHVVKGVDMLLAAFARVMNEDPNLHLAIAGPGEEALVEQLRQQAKALSLDSRVTWLGMMKGPLKWATLYASHAFVLPSHHENFGVAVAEALGCGVPALISNQVNIWREVVDGQAGFAAPDSVDGTESNLRRWLAQTPDELAELAAAARRTYQRHFTVEAMATGLVNEIQTLSRTGEGG
jgi:glycosyltransferase involved in cell wall biosynthesis